MFTILFLGANPVDTDRLRLDEEYREITSRLARSAVGELRIETKLAVRAQDLQKAFMDVRPSIVHFTGHGDAAGQILLENTIGFAEPIDPKAFADLFRLFQDDVRCVVLSACNSSEQAERIAEVVDSAVGFSDGVTVGAARSFMASFYQGLAQGRDVMAAFEFGRNQMQLEYPEDPGKPRLYLREGIERVFPIGPAPHLIGALTVVAAQREASDQPDEFLDETEPVLIWNLPRGFILLDSLLREGTDSWATRAHYYDYTGRYQGGTHYHDSYRSREILRAFRMHFNKLAVPVGDRQIGAEALHLMMDIREGRYVMTPSGTLFHGAIEVDLPPFAHVYPQVRFPYQLFLPSCAR
jgi:hypothetical protein